MRDNAWFGNWESVWWKLEAALYWNEFTTLNTASKQHVYLDALKKWWYFKIKRLRSMQDWSNGISSKAPVLELDLSTALLHVNEQKFYDVFKGESREDNARLILF